MSKDKLKKDDKIFEKIYKKKRKLLIILKCDYSLRFLFVYKLFKKREAIKMIKYSKRYL